LISQNEIMIYSGYFFGLTGQFTVDLGYRLSDEATEFMRENALELTVQPNRLPNGLSLSSDRVPEDAEPGTVIGVFSAADPDRADRFQFGLVDAAERRFRIVGDELQVNNGALFNSNRNTSHDIMVRVTDAYGGFIERDFSIEIVAVASANGPQRILLNKNQVKENAPIGTVIGRFLTVSRYHKPYHYQLLDDATGRFIIIDDLLLVADSAHLDYETDTEHEIEVESIDPDSGQAISERFNIELQNQPDVNSQFNELPADPLAPMPPAANAAFSHRLLLQWQSEQAHIGQTAKIFILFADKGLNTILMLTPAGEWAEWDRVISSLQSFTELTLKKQHHLVLHINEINTEFAFAEGQLFFAYQLLNGELLYEPLGEPLSELQMIEIEESEEIL
jgi:hypothetical protein